MLLINAFGCSSFSLLTVSFCSCLVQFSYLNTVCFGPLHFPSSFLQLQEALELQFLFLITCTNLELHTAFWPFAAHCPSAFLTSSVLFLSQTSLVFFVPASVLPVAFPYLHLLALFLSILNGHFP